MAKVPQPGVDLIKGFEGFRSEAYTDPLSGNKPITIGYGCTRKKDGGEWELGETISEAEALELLIEQLENQYLPSLQKIPCWEELNENQQGALLSFGYNLGADFYGNPNFATMTRVLKERAWDEIEETFLKYRNPGSAAEEGLKRRRQAEARLFTHGLTSIRLQDILKSATRVQYEAIAQDEGLSQQIQTRLIALGLLTPPADGKFGPNSKAALQKFQRLAEIDEEYLGIRTAKALIEAKSI